MRRAVKPALLATAILVAAPATAQAPETFRLSLGYDGRLLVKVLDIQMEQQASAAGFTASVRLKSSGVLSAFKKIEQRASSQGTIVRGGAQPQRFNHQNLDGKKNRKVQVDWTGSEVTAVAVPPYGKKLGDPPATLAQKLEAADPLTQLVRISLGDSQSDFCRGTLKFFDGKQRYDLDFLNRQTTAPSAREKRLGLIQPVRCTVRYREVAGFRKRAPGEKGGLDRPIVMGFARAGAQGPWVISFIDAQTPLGHAVIDLQRVKASGAAPQG
jgi:hypothetical protein